MDEVVTGLSPIGQEADVGKWQPIETAPRDGTWFVICRIREGYESYECGRYDPWMQDEYIDVGGGMYRKEKKVGYEWRGFNNFNRATHWMPLPPPPTTSTAGR